MRDDKRLAQELTERPKISERMRRMLDLHDAGRTERQIAKQTGTPKTTVHRLIAEGTARRYGLGRRLGELNRGCQGNQWGTEKPPIPTIDPMILDEINTETAMIM